eukprot:CAMPEP_0172162628 /NCGR_PEP_ID=MMETSP1050-20130122/6784_1 /TAXON_ID=233186 /ORGANISM="Cryptomonas curvata, Strain CCAP979/52" /LENGTH=161 /DNA_ID=CAMNT_0012832653 /DNA_START=132 /DNA_END=614 /DNA_ORIENTATION=-
MVCCRRTASPSFALVTEEEAQKGAYKAKIETLDRETFMKLSSLDFTRTIDVLGPAAGTAPAVVFVHGGGSCRTMFLYHAREFAKQGYRCVLLDLPGHGARMDEPLTMTSAIAAILDAVRLEAPPTADGRKPQKPLYIGGSLGGYIGMELLGAHPDVFAGAV